MSIDLVSNLTDDWWTSANNAAKFKPKYECIQEVLKILCGDNKGKKALPHKIIIKDNKKSNDFLKIIINWLVKENHVFTRLYILKILPLLIRSFSIKIIQKYQLQIIQTICTKQWTNKKAQFVALSTPVLLELIQKTEIQLNNDDIKPYLMNSFKHKNIFVRRNISDFISKLTFYPQQKKSLTQFLCDKNIANILKKLAQNDKDKKVKILGCKCLYSIIVNTKIINIQLQSVWTELLNHKWSKNNIREAKILYTVDKDIFDEFGSFEQRQISNNACDEQKDTQQEEKEKEFYVIPSIDIILHPLLNIIDRTIQFVENSGNLIIDKKSGIMIEEMEQNCLLIHNAITMDEQIELFQDIKKKDKTCTSTGKLTQKKGYKPKLGYNEKWGHHIYSNYQCIFQETNLTDGKMKDTIYGKMKDKAVNVIDRNYKMKYNENMKINWTKYPLSTIRGIKYKSPNDGLVRHIDNHNGLVYLFSIGCTANFCVYGPNMKNEIIFKFKSGDMLFFDASQQAAIRHGVVNIDTKSCPKELQKYETLQNYRIGLQFRTYS